MSRKLLFVMFAVLVIAGNWLAIATFDRWQVGPIPEWPLAVDLLLLLPCAYLWVGRRVIAEIFLGLDEPAAFMATLERELPAVR